MGKSLDKNILSSDKFLSKEESEELSVLSVPDEYEVRNRLYKERASIQDTVLELCLGTYKLFGDLMNLFSKTTEEVFYERKHGKTSGYSFRN